MRRPIPWLVAGAALMACSSASTSPPAATSCNPLAAHPTMLATILGVGKDEAGTLYVAEQGGVAGQPSSVRVFVAVAGSLVRQHVIGSGSSSGEDIETFEKADGSTAPRDLAIQVANGKATSMTLGPEGSAKSRIEGMDGGAALCHGGRSCCYDSSYCLGSCQGLVGQTETNGVISPVLGLVPKGNCTRLVPKVTVQLLTFVCIPEM